MVAVEHDIDFVITWVDGSDPAWLAERAEYMSEAGHAGVDVSDARYRDWGLLKYLFRGIEAFAPWVRKVHFVTWGHLPRWLNTDHPKINIVNHHDYIPAQYLPTFNSRTIELNSHHIHDLAEHYVYFNDDMFLLKPVAPTIFFYRGLPCDSAVIMPIIGSTPQHHSRLEDINWINTHICKRVSSVARHPMKWLTPRYGTYLLSNLLRIAGSGYHTGFINPHLPQPSLKSTLEAMWLEDPVALQRACCRFRNNMTLNIYAQRYVDLACGRFSPIHPESRGRCFHLRRDNVGDAVSFIQRRKKPFFCINDNPDQQNSQDIAAQVRIAFDSIFPHSSQFETYV